MLLVFLEIVIAAVLVIKKRHAIFEKRFFEQSIEI